ncbi:bacterial transcriptional activator domain-containing protein [Glutamicibacter sp. MNS18]|uniref:AfsR/SARP family transcriptional regulator n=1 Tax=Glutamicibacter sp. MNS18 TaxID=2989817 RepID=UPI00223604B3|nr:bacterial transcriptional activator domain-containing protein [Glutamicibacter sp. MNS18]MCW4464803.1 bacterial transcriptional activator domain-containing protein [Glutamicibacter sp. MNS18]
MPEFEVRLLERWRLLRDGSAVPLRLREQRVICLLALRGAMPRRRVAGILWPETTESRALDSLRVSLHHIHRQAPGLLGCSDGWLDLAEQTPVDVHRHTAELEKWGGTANLGCTELEQLLRGAQLLPDWDEPWLAADQEELRQLRARALQNAAHEQLARGNHHQALRLGRAALDLDPISESAASILARAEAGEGNRAGAAAGLLLFIKRLQEDLGIGPGPEVTRMLAQLRSS